MKLNFFLIIFIILSIVKSLSDETTSQSNLEDPYYKLGWKNLENSEAKVIDIPGANASLEIIKSEIYIDEKEKLKNYRKYMTGQDINDELQYSMIISDKDDYYKIEISYDDAGYVTTNRFKNVTSDNLLMAMKKVGGDKISEIKWINKPNFEANKPVNYAIKIFWSDSDITYEFKSLILGREGYLTLSLYADGSVEDEIDLTNFYSEILDGISSSVLFKENYTYLDYQSGDYISSYSLSNLIDSSYGNENAADQTLIMAFCLPNTENLKDAGIASSDYERFAGKEIIFFISETRNEIADISDDESVSVLTGMYGIADKQPYTKTNNIINYTNEIELEGDNKDDKLKYNYKNKIIFKNKKANTFSALIDQSGLSFNKWNLKINCRDYEYNEAEKLAAKKVISKLDKMNELLKKIDRNKKN